MLLMKWTWAVLFLDAGLVDAYCIGPDRNDTVWTAELAQRIV